MNNPLMDQTGLPAFSKIEPGHVEPAVDTLLASNREQIQQLLAALDTPTWANLIEPIEEWDDRLSRTWSPVQHLNSVVNTDELRSAYNACLPKLSQYATEMGQNEQLFNAYRRLAESDQPLDGAQRKVLENALRDFHLSGVDLTAEKKQRFQAIAQELSGLTSKFSENVLDATHAWSKHIGDPAHLAGLPPTALGLARQHAEQRELEGWLLTLDFPCYLPVMTYADNRELRFEMYEAYNTRASELGPHGGQYDNSKLMDQILALRHEKAQLLGYANYAELSLVPKMARSPAEVESFLLDLARRSKAQAERELEELQSFAQVEFGTDQLAPWDIPYYSEKLRQARYNISQEELKPYFPETRVIPGMFAVIGRLFGVTIREAQERVDLWHPDVKFYEIRDQHTGELRGQFYFDLYARSKKRGGAWMDECQGRMRTAHREQLPVAYMTCNFTPPVGDRPALLTHEEVQTLFHEFGHGLHHMLTRIDYPAVSGINGVAWDAVELPSQFMENFCWEKVALDLISGHLDTGEAIPDELFARITAAKHFQSAMAMVRQLEFALFDIRIHRDYDPSRGARIYQTLEQVREEVAVVRPPIWNRFPHGFSHIFAGGYAAGYYSYKWAEVLSADAFSLFEEHGILDHRTGRSFLCNILEKGGSADALELYVAFRGREPQIEALLRHSGITA